MNEENIEEFRQILKKEIDKMFKKEFRELLGLSKEPESDEQYTKRKLISGAIENKN